MKNISQVSWVLSEKVTFKADVVSLNPIAQFYPPVAP